MRDLREILSAKKTVRVELSFTAVANATPTAATLSAPSVTDVGNWETFDVTLTPVVQNATINGANVDVVVAWEGQAAYQIEGQPAILIEEIAGLASLGEGAVLTDPKRELAVRQGSIGELLKWAALAQAGKMAVADFAAAIGLALTGANVTGIQGLTIKVDGKTLDPAILETL